MKLSQTAAEVWIPDGVSEDAAFARVTHMCIAAHPDDVEVMALDGILKGLGAKKSFLAVIVSDGAGSPRQGDYTTYSAEQMKAVRRMEQKKAAFVGDYSAAVLLEHPSAELKKASNQAPKADLKMLIAAAGPQIIYTHNLADKHDTHIAVALRTVTAIRELPREQRPQKLYGCEVWRDLDWLLDSDKVVFTLDEHENIAAALVGVFDSQIAGGKRYDLAALARRRANATFFQSHAVDSAQMLSFAMDLTPLVQDEKLDPAEYIRGFTQRFSEDVESRIKKFL